MMTSLLTYARWPSADTRQYFFWRYPQWWTVVLCGAAWAVLLLQGWRHAGHEVHHRMTFSQELAHWLLMVAAMMLPFVLHIVWGTAISSLWTRRHRAIAGFLAGYFVPWLVLGVVAAMVRGASWSHTYILAALSFVLAALWQLTPLYRRALLACHRTHPLAPTGWRANRDCLQFGGLIGIACLGSCWPLMLACAFAGHSMIAMVGGMAVGMAERWSFRPRTRTRLAGTLGLASYYLALAVVDQGLAFTAL